MPPTSSPFSSSLNQYALLCQLCTSTSAHSLSMTFLVPLNPIYDNGLYDIVLQKVRSHSLPAPRLHPELVRSMRRVRLVRTVFLHCITIRNSGERGIGSFFINTVLCKYRREIHPQEPQIRPPGKQMPSPYRADRTHPENGLLCASSSRKHGAIWK